MIEGHDHRLGTYQALTAMMDVAKMLTSKESTTFASIVLLMMSLMRLAFFPGRPASKAMTNQAIAATVNR